MRNNRLFAALVAFAFACLPVAAQELPRLSRDGDGPPTLIVDGEPFLVLGGELGNSSASDIAYMDEIWPALDALGLNTIIAPVYWELIEPQEGEFDFTLVDALLNRARAHDQRLVLLWFGSWKNLMSSYAPAWVKRDTQRFPRAQTLDGETHELLTPFSENNLEADKKAFAALMAYLAKADRKNRTVIMVQVENEIGMLKNPRDHGALANAAYTAPVPQSLIDALAERPGALAEDLVAAWKANGEKTSGSWAEVLGGDARGQEIFMAWSFARYVEEIARAGKSQYDIPVYVNAALYRPGTEPGEYPSAGPLPHLKDLWEIGAPSIDFLAPDIYFPNFVYWMNRYVWPGNMLFIPEAHHAGAAEAPANALYVFGELDAMGFSPFSIESIDDPETSSLKDAYALLKELAPLILAHRGKETMKGLRAPVSFEGEADLAPQSFDMGEYRIEATFIDPWIAREEQAPETHGAIIIQLSNEEFLFAGAGVTFTFGTMGDDRAGIERADEGRYDNGVWKPGRRMN
ncbi:MAG: DUF5597 domain-containing protein, partial [Oricola sp.]|nr:DUF5597 domain-containing protein [Oricola sp.]